MPNGMRQSDSSKDEWDGWDIKYPTLPEWHPNLHKANHCSKCGLTLSEIMMYVCPHPDCPCGLGGPVCTI